MLTYPLLLIVRVLVCECLTASVYASTPETLLRYLASNFATSTYSAYKNMHAYSGCAALVHTYYISTQSMAHALTLCIPDVCAQHTLQHCVQQQQVAQQA
jgi:uncharacterized membrane protein SpoIIM required for sporulation